MKASSSIAVLMTCYNRVETTLRCLHSLFNQTIKQSDNQTISLDVWLVDDASTDHAVLFRYRNWGIGMAAVCLCHMLARAVFNWNE